MTRKLGKKIISYMPILIGVGFVRQAIAISILEEMESKQPNKFQKDLIENPKKQKLIAEIAECVAQPPFPHKIKLKCLSDDW